MGRLVARVLWVVAGLLLAAALGLALGPRFLPFEVYAVDSASMAPAIPPGALIFMTPAMPEQLRVGDVITFPRPGHPGELITHRIVAIDQGSGSRDSIFQTKGDANAQPDGWLVSLHGRGWRYAFGVGILGFVVAAAQSSTGRLAAIIIPSLLLGLSVLVQIWRRRPFPVPAA